MIKKSNPIIGIKYGRKYRDISCIGELRSHYMEENIEIYHVSKATLLKIPLFVAKRI